MRKDISFWNKLAILSLALQLIIPVLVACGDVEKEKSLITPDTVSSTLMLSPTEMPNPPEDTQNAIYSLKLTKTIEFANSRRPKIAETDDRIFMIYGDLLDNSFKVKIFDKSLYNEIMSKILVSRTSKYGNPTDIRVTADSDYIYIFYEVADGVKRKAYLFGEKYTLDDDFKRVNYTGIISEGKYYSDAETGDEKLDDPIPVLGEDKVFVITRYKASFDVSGKTRYRVYEFTKNLTQIKTFDLDLSSVADGGARQSSALYYDGFYYMVLPTTNGESGGLAINTISDILMVKFDSDWNLLESKVISDDHDDIERYVTGFAADDGYFFVAYNQRKGNRLSAPLKVFDCNFNLIYKTSLASGVVNPDICARDNHVTVGISHGQQLNALQPLDVVARNRRQKADENPQGDGSAQSIRTIKDYSEIFVFEKR